MARFNRDHALLLLELAGKDHKALSNMRDAEVFEEEIFGFHAQQAIEKTLKAWIAAIGLVYPKPHDVSVLTTILRGAGADLSGFPDLEDFSIYAVQYRYEAYDEPEEKLDREETIAATRILIEQVREVIHGVE